ncbi:MAG: hypothetical protein K2M25_03095 [Muribaculaceae bacterium]|nr:hypothetical protein [Muribaculaceae bacterium]
MREGNSKQFIMKEESNDYKDIIPVIKHLLELKAENIGLILSRKLTMLLGIIAVSVIVLVTLGVMIAFLGVAFADYLNQFMPLYCSYLIMTGIVAVIFAIVIIFRRHLIYDPLCRFISRLIFEP